MTRISLLFIVFSLVAHAMFSQSEAVLDAYEQRQYRNGEGDSLLYRWLAPDSVIPTEPYPLILFLHGSGERGDDNTAQLKHVLPRFLEAQRPERFPCYIFAPQCPAEQRWSDGVFDQESGRYFLRDTMSQSLTLTMQALGTIINRYPIDTTRIYIAGLSMGGAGVWELAFRYPGIFAAAIPICGFADLRYAKRAIDLPIWVFHGSEDEVVSPQYSRQVVALLRLSGGDPVYTEFVGIGHESWGPAFSNLPFVYDWLFAQRKSLRED